MHQRLGLNNKGTAKKEREMPTKNYMVLRRKQREAEKDDT